MKVEYVLLKRSTRERRKNFVSGFGSSSVHLTPAHHNRKCLHRVFTDHFSGMNFSSVAHAYTKLL